MSRKMWKILAAMVVLLVVAGAAGAAGVFWWQKSRVAEWRSRAEQEYAAKNWVMSIRFYGRYLTQVPDDLEALTHYAEASLNVPSNREASLRGATVAYLQYLQYEPGSKEVQDKLLRLYEKLRSWPDLEHFAQLFLQERPDDPMLLYYIGLAQARSQVYDDAAKSLQDAIAHGSAPPEAYEELAGLMLEQQKPEEGDKVIAAAVEARPDDVEMHLAAVRYYRRARSEAGVQRHLDEALRLEPENAKALLEAARQAFQQRDLAKATEYCEKALTSAPKDPDVIILLGHVYALREEPAKAIEALQRLNRLDRADNPEAVILLADLLCSQRRTEEAKPYVEEYVDSNPGQQPISDYFEGRELLAEGDFPRAAEVLEEVVQKLPGFPPAQFFLGVAYLQSGQRSLGRTTLEGYVRKNPGDRKAAALYAQEFGPPMSPAEAEEAAEQLMASDNASAVDLVNAAREVAQTYGRNTPKEEAEVLARLLEEAVRRDPKLAIAYRALAEMQLARGDIPAARQALDSARAAGIGDKDFRRTRASIALAEKNVDAAKAEMDAALSEEPLTVRDVGDWAAFLASEGQPDLAREALQKGGERLGEEAGSALEVERAAIAAQYDKPEAARLVVEEVASRIGQDQNLTRRVNDARLEVARRLLIDDASGGEAEARDLVGKVLAQDPREPTALALQAQMLLKQDSPDVPGAQNLLETVLQKDGQNFVALLGLAEIQYRQGDAASALRYAEQASKVSPRSVPASLLRAQLLMELQRHLEAQAVLDTVLLDDPGNLQALRLYVESCIASNRVPEARQFLSRLEQAAASDPAQAATVEALRGRLLMAEGTPGEAETLLRGQYEANKDDLTALRNLASTVASLDRLEEVEALYRDYTDRHKDSAQAWVDLARLYLLQASPERLSQASDALTRALLIDPNHVQAVREMIHVQMLRGNLIEALNWCNRYLERDNDNAQVLYQKGLLLRQRGELKGAVEALDAAIAADDQADYRALRGLVHLDLKDYGKSLDDLQQVAGGTRPTTAQVDLGLAEAYLSTGRNDLARQYYDSAKQKVNEGKQRVDAARMASIGERLNALGSAT